MAGFDLGVLAATGRSRSRVAIVPTAAFPSGEHAYARLAEQAQAHFRALGAEVETVDVRNRAAANDGANAQVAGEADVIYICGGRAGHLRASLHGTAVADAVRDANARGAVLVGCSAGAMVLGECLPDVGVRRGWPIHWAPGLAIAGGITVLPEYDARPEAVMALLAMRAPRGMAVMGIDRATAVIGRDGSWVVHGRGRVTVWRSGTRHRHRDGDTFLVAGNADLAQHAARSGEA